MYNQNIVKLKDVILTLNWYLYLHTHTHTHIYIYICVYVYIKYLHPNIIEKPYIHATKILQNIWFTLVFLSCFLFILFLLPFFSTINLNFYF